MRKINKLLLLAFIVIISSCSPDYTKIIKEPEKKFYNGQPVEAARVFIPHINKKNKDQLLFLMEAGLMLHTADEYTKSAEVFSKAGQVAATISTSLTKQAASLFLNEKSTNYKGEDFERVLIHMYLGINYLMVKNPESARVEFKKVNDELNRINQQSGKQYRQNIMAKYLTAIAYEMIGDMDNDQEAWEYAYVEYKQIYGLQPGLALVYRDLERISAKLKYTDDYRQWLRKFGKKDAIPAGAGELIVIYQAGRSAIKQSRGPLMSDKAMAGAIQVAIGSMSFEAGVTIAAITATLRNAEHPIPKFVKRSNRIQKLNIVINGRTEGSTIMLEDIENTAVKTLRDDYSRIYKKVAAGIVTKVAASIATGIAAKKIAEQADNAYIKAASGCIGIAAGAGTGAALMSQIKPDLRCWHSLPANLQLERIFLKPGKYTLTLQFIDKNGAVVRTETDEVEVTGGGKTFVNYRTLY